MLRGMDKGFGLPETTLLKGVAICMLLCHHLYFVPEADYTDWFVGGRPLWNSLATVCKPTVALFLLLSGFGLYRSSLRKPLSLNEFYKKRLLRLYPTYFLIWLTFVPLTLIFTDRSLLVAFGDHIPLRLLANVLGIQMYFDFFGYNPTWWFMTTILSLYALFPFCLRLAQTRRGLEILTVVIMLMDAFDISPIGGAIRNVLRQWLFPFTLGMLLAKHSWIEKSVHLPRLPLLAACGAVCLGGAWMRLAIGSVGNPLWADTFFAAALIIPVLATVTRGSYIFSFLSLLGQHSYSIFLSHTFLNAWLLHGLVYATRNPIIIFFTSLAVCLPAGIFIDRLQQRLTQKYFTPGGAAH